MIGQRSWRSRCCSCLARWLRPSCLTLQSSQASKGNSLLFRSSNYRKTKPKTIQEWFEQFVLEVCMTDERNSEKSEPPSVVGNASTWQCLCPIVHLLQNICHHAFFFTPKHPTWPANSAAHPASRFHPFVSSFPPVGTLTSIAVGLKELPGCLAWQRRRLHEKEAGAAANTDLVLWFSSSSQPALLNCTRCVKTVGACFYCRSCGCLPAELILFLRCRSLPLTCILSSICASA